MNIYKANKERLYQTWYNMVSRCHNKSDKQYCDYGAKIYEYAKSGKTAFRLLHGGL